MYVQNWNPATPPHLAVTWTPRAASPAKRSTRGFVATELTKNLTASLTDQLKAQGPLGRFDTVDEIATAVAFPASDGS